jgi:hypothetical protein
MNTPFSPHQKNNWHDVRQAADSLAHAGALITDASRMLERFCHPADPDNWDRTFAWKLNELKQAANLCREVEQHLKNCAHQAKAGDRAAKT